MSSEDDSQKHTQAQRVFARLRGLSGESSESAFWEGVAECVAGLCRSPMGVVYRVGEGGLEVVANYPAGPDQDREASFRARVAATGAKLAKRGYVFEPLADAAWAGRKQPFLLTFLLGPTGEYLAAVVTEHADVERFNEVVVRTQLIGGWVDAAKGGARNGSIQAGAIPASAGILAMLDEVHGQNNFWPAAMTLVDALVVRLGAARVSIGWLRGEFFRTVAVSGLEKFDPNADAVSDLERVFEECADHENCVVVPVVDGGEAGLTKAHETYAATETLRQLISVPILGRGQPLGVIVIEMVDSELAPSAIDEIAVTAQLGANWLEVLQRRERSWWQKSTDAARGWGAGWLGPRHTLAKLLTVSFSVFLLLGVLVRIDFEVDATATLETDQVSYLSAPFNGFVEEVTVEAGEAVLAGQVLITLNREELELRELEETANLQRFNSEVEKARSARDLVDMKVAQARMRQAETELERTRYYLAKATLTAAFDGIVVEGERRELVGAPVGQGDVLMKIADPSKLFVRIKLNERDIDFVQTGSVGEIRLLSQPDRTHAITVTRVVPAAEVDMAEGNVFVLRAGLDDGQEMWWRPGMSGAVRLDAGKRSILGVWFHRTWEAVRMRFWL